MNSERSFLYHMLPTLAHLHEVPIFFFMTVSLQNQHSIVYDKPHYGPPQLYYGSKRLFIAPATVWQEIQDAWSSFWKRTQELLHEWWLGWRFFSSFLLFLSPSWYRAGMVMFFCYGEEEEKENPRKLCFHPIMISAHGQLVPAFDMEMAYWSFDEQTGIAHFGQQMDALFTCNCRGGLVLYSKPKVSTFGYVSHQGRPKACTIKESLEQHSTANRQIVFWQKNVFFSAFPRCSRRAYVGTTWMDLAQLKVPALCGELEARRGRVP